MKLKFTLTLVAATLVAMWPGTRGDNQLKATSDFYGAQITRTRPSGIALRPIGSLPLAFTENEGQWDECVKFRANSGGATMWLTTDGVYHQFTRLISREASNPSGLPDDAFSHELDSLDQLVIRTSFVGANPTPHVVGEESLTYKCNYFIGNDPDKWHTDVPNYRAVVFKDIYDGIDLRYYSNEEQMEYDFIVSPGADPDQIVVQYDGATSIGVNADGQLVVETKWGTITELRPLVYQLSSHERRSVECRYVSISDNSFGFILDEGYDPSLALVIDPPIVYSTYLGGNGDDAGTGIAVGEDGSVYVTGWTVSTDFPTLNEYQSDQPNYDAFVSKLNSDGNGLVYSTYLGGTGADYGYGIAIDDFGNAYIVGQTNGDDFPTFNEYQTYQPGWDAVVAKLNSSGNDLVYSTYLGGDNNDLGFRIAVDANGSAYVVGETASSDFPTLNHYQSDQPSHDAFVSKFGSEGSLIYSTYLGGSQADAGLGIAVDQFGNAYVVGRTLSPDFPTLNPYQTDQYGSDAFVTKLNSAGGGLIYSTYLGGDGTDEANDIDVDLAGNPYVTGNTWSTDFPTVDPYQTDQPGADAFVTALDASGSAVTYSTYLGGDYSDWGWALATVSDGSVYIAGETFSSDFPTIWGLQTDQGGGDAFVARLNVDGTGPAFSTYLGGSGDDECADIAVHPSSNEAFVTGTTWSADFPTEGPYQTNQADMDAFVTKFDAEICGDIVANWGVDLIDYFAMTEYLWYGGSDPAYSTTGDVDSISGITNHDLYKLVDFLDGGLPLYCPPVPDSILPVSNDVLELRNTTIPPLVTSWKVDAWLKMDAEQVLAISFPFAFSCSTSAITCDSVSFVNSIYGESFGGKVGPIDALLQKGAIGIVPMLTGTPDADSGLVASLWFSVNSSAENQEIVLDTTTFGYGQRGEEHIVIFSKDVDGKPYAFIPLIPGIGSPPTVVTNLNDSGYGSLRYAMQYADTNSVIDTISFGVSGAIELLSPLPPLTSVDATLISGATAPGGSYSIVVDGSALISGSGFAIESSNNQISGLTIKNFPDNGITVTGELAVNNEFGDNLIYDNGGLAIDLGDDGVTENDSLDLDTGPNDLINYPEIDSVRMNPDSSFTVRGSTAEASMSVIFYIAHTAKDPTQVEDPSGHGEAFEIVGTVASDPTFEFTVPNTIPFFSVLTATATRQVGPAVTSEFCENFKLVPGPLVVTAYSYPAGEKAPPSVVNLWITDPEGHYIGRNAQDEHFQDLFPATYEEEPPEYNDVVTIPYPIEGTYIIEIIGEGHAQDGDQYSAGVIIDGSASVTLAHQNSVPLTSMPPDSIEYVVEEDWHYVNGDADGNDSVDIDDVVYLINYIFAGGPIPDPPDAGDADCSYALDIDDVVYLIAFIFSSGPAPCAAL